MLLYEKYTPYTLNGVLASKSALQKLVSFGEEVHKGNRVKPLLICGPSGTGKTTAARALAFSSGFDLIERGSNDYRDAETLNKTLLPASQSRGLFNKTSLILLDEIDELSTREDAGAERVINQLIKESRQPIIFIANDFWDRKIAFLREKVDKVEFKRVGSDAILELLRGIAQKESGSIDNAVLEEIAKRSNGDIRGAINDLELMMDAKPDLVENLGMRDRKMEVFAVLDKIFLASNFDMPRNAMNSSDLSVDMLLNWVNENIPYRYTSVVSISDAYEILSRASMFLEKAERVKYYGYIRYTSVLLSSGVSLANAGRRTTYKPYEFPSNIRYLSRTKKNRDEVNRIAVKLMPQLHSHKKDIVNGFLPLLNLMLTKSGEKKEAEAFFGQKYGLEKDELKVVEERFKYSS